MSVRAQFCRKTAEAASLRQLNFGSGDFSSLRFVALDYDVARINKTLWLLVPPFSGQPGMQSMQGRMPLDRRKEDSGLPLIHVASRTTCDSLNPPSTSSAELMIFHGNLEVTRVRGCESLASGRTRMRCSRNLLG